MAGPTYEEVNWARLSPAFRAVHNRLRKAKGLRPIPEPKVDLYVPPQPTGVRVPTADDEKAAMAELGIPCDTLQVAEGEVQVWEGITERLQLEAKHLALKNAQTRLQDRELKTEVLHTTIVKVATMFLSTAPEAARTKSNTIAAVMRFFGAKRGEKSRRRVWVGGEVSEKTVRNVLKEAEGKALADGYNKLRQ